MPGTAPSFAPSLDTSGEWVIAEGYDPNSGTTGTTTFRKDAVTATQDSGVNYGTPVDITIVYVAVGPGAIAYLQLTLNGHVASDLTALLA